MKTLQEILMENAKARGAVEQGTDQLSEIDNADFADYVPPGMPKIENPTSIPLEEHLTYAELAKQQAIPADYMKNALAESQEQSLVAPMKSPSRAPAAQTLGANTATAKDFSPTEEQPLGVGERLTKLMAERNAAYAEADKGQRNQELIGSLAGNLGNIIGGAQAMNTGASVTPVKTGFAAQNLTKSVDGKYKPELDSMMTQYKALQAAKAKQASLANSDRTYNLQLAKFNQDEKFFNRAQDGREEGKADLKEDKFNRNVQKAADKLGNGQDLLNALGNFETQLKAKLDDLSLDEDRNLTHKDGRKLDLPGVNVPGIGNLSFYDGKARDVSTAMAKVFNVELKDRSGTAVTSTELEKLKLEFAQGKFNTEGEMVQAIKNYKALVALELRNREAGFSPDVIKEYKERGGATSERFNTAPAVSAPAGGKITVRAPSGATMEVSEENAKQYLSRPGYTKVN